MSNGWIEDIYQEIEDQVTREYNELRSVGFLPYIGQNISNNMRQEYTEFVETIEEYMPEITARIDQEVAQFNEMGFIPYLAQNTTTLVAQQSRQHGHDDIADAIEENRSRIMAEARQLEDMGMFPYFTQNSITLLKQKAIEDGNDELLTQIETYTPYLMERATQLQASFNEITTPLREAATETMQQIEEEGIEQYTVRQANLVAQELSENYNEVADEIQARIEHTLNPEVPSEQREDLRSSLKAQEGEQYYNPLTASQSLRYDFNLLGRQQNTPTQEQETNTYIPYPLRINTNENER